MIDSPTSRELLIIFTRFPFPGQAKTRLIPRLGAQGAADLQRMMTECTFTSCCELAARRHLQVQVFYEGGKEDEITKWLPIGMSHQPQYPGDFGQRIEHAFEYGFLSEMERVIIVGSDCPSLTAKIIEEGFDCLKKTDLVLGPAHDGGYYMIGLRKQAGLLWQNVSWGTKHVLAQTLKNAKNISLSHSLLKTLADVDRPEDLPGHYKDGKCFMSMLFGSVK